MRSYCRHRFCYRHAAFDIRSIFESPWSACTPSAFVRWDSPRHGIDMAECGTTRNWSCNAAGLAFTASATAGGIYIIFPHIYIYCYIHKLMCRYLWYTLKFIMSSLTVKAGMTFKLATPIDCCKMIWDHAWPVTQPEFRDSGEPPPEYLALEMRQSHLKMSIWFAMIIMLSHHHRHRE